MEFLGGGVKLKLEGGKSQCAPPPPPLYTTLVMHVSTCV
jgi:hypothetical protein